MPRSASPASETGASALEFALVSSILVLLLLAITQFGLAYHARQGLEAAAREGARTASIPGSTIEDISLRVRGSMGAVEVGDESCPPSVGEYCIAVAPARVSPCLGRSGDDVRVTVTHRRRIEIPLWASPEVSLAGEGVFRCE